MAEPNAEPRNAATKEQARDVPDTPTDLGRGFIRLLHRSGREATERWLRQDAKTGASRAATAQAPVEPALA